MSFDVDGILARIKKLPPYERQELLDEISEKYGLEASRDGLINAQQVCVLKWDIFQKEHEIEQLKKQNEKLKEKADIIEELRAENDRLRARLREGLCKVHFDLDGVQTACGLDIFSVETADNMADVTCRNCKRIWGKMKKEWDKEWKREEV